MGGGMDTAAASPNLKHTTFKRPHLSLHHTESTLAAPGMLPQDWDFDTEADSEMAHELQKFLPQQRNIVLAQGPKSIRLSLIHI